MLFGVRCVFCVVRCASSLVVSWLLFVVCGCAVFVGSWPLFVVVVSWFVCCVFRLCLFLIMVSVCGCSLCVVCVLFLCCLFACCVFDVVCCVLVVMCCVLLDVWFVRVRCGSFVVSCLLVVV